MGPRGRLPLQPAEEHAVLDGDRRLVGQRAQQRGVTVAEQGGGLALGLGDDQRADDRAVGAGDGRGQGADRGQVLEPRRAARAHADPARHAVGHERPHVGGVVGRRHVDLLRTGLDEADAPGRLVLAQRAQQQDGPVGPQQAAGGFEHGVGDLGQVGGAHHRRDELVVGLEAAVPLRQAGVDPVRGVAGGADRGEQQGHVRVLPEGCRQADADGGVEDSGRRPRANEHDHRPPTRPFAAHQGDGDGEGGRRGGVAGEHPREQGERAPHADRVGFAQHQAEHDDRRHGLGEVDRHLVEELAEAALAGDDQHDRHAHHAGQHQVGGVGVDQAHGQGDHGQHVAVQLTLAALDPDAERLAAQEGRAEPESVHLEGRAGEGLLPGDHQSVQDGPDGEQRQADRQHGPIEPTRLIPRQCL